MKKDLKLKAERREKRKIERKAVGSDSGTLAGQVLKLKVSRHYRGDVKKI